MPRRLDEKTVYDLEEAILKTLDCTDAERNYLYGEVGWKLLIKRYIADVRVSRQKK